MAGQKEFDQLLDKIVTDAGGDLESIIIFDLSEGLPLYHNKGLKDRNLKLYSALFGEEDDIGGEAIEGFNTLNQMQKAFNNFGQKTGFGEQKSTNVNFANGKMMIYFYQAPDIPTAICFLASKEINLASINRRANQVIGEIKQKLAQL
jgi:ABC-type glycerol-3-phosphate transport system substrate-binding protein